jgi:hypothetical protein
MAMAMPMPQPPTSPLPPPPPLLLPPSRPLRLPLHQRRRRLCLRLRLGPRRRTRRLSALPPALGCRPWLPRLPCLLRLCFKVAVATLR